MTAATTDAVTFSLEIPPDPTLLSSARLFAAAVAREAGCPEELLDDVKLAVSEACTEAIRRTVRAEGTIALRAALTSEGLAFEVSGPADGIDPPQDELDHFSLISALFDDARRDGSATHGGIAFTVPRSADAAG